MAAVCAHSPIHTQRGRLSSDRRPQPVGYNADMTVTIAPLSANTSGSAGYAAEMAAALSLSLPDGTGIRVGTVGQPAPGGPEPDIVHFVADSSHDLHTYAADFVRSAHSAGAVLTILGIEDPDSEISMAMPDAWSRIIVLTDASRKRLVEAGADPARVVVVPAYVPAPETEAEPADAAESGIALMCPVPPPPTLLRELVGALPELPRNTSLTVGIDGDSPDRGIMETAVREAAHAAGVSLRVQTKAVRTRPEVHRLLSGSPAVVAFSPAVAGPWHTFAPLAFGQALLAPPGDLYYDLMQRGHCVRLIDAEKPGHIGACLRAILSNPIGLAELRDRGLRYATLHSPGRTAERMLAVYEDVRPTSRRGGAE